MTTNRRKAELRQEREQQDREREAEDHRVFNLTWFERIEEIADIHDAKRVLHEIVEHLDERLKGGFERNPIL